MADSKISNRGQMAHTTENEAEHEEHKDHEEREEHDREDEEYEDEEEEEEGDEGEGDKEEEERKETSQRKFKFLLSCQIKTYSCSSSSENALERTKIDYCQPTYNPLGPYDRYDKRW
jgi:hypothetical protein